MRTHRDHGITRALRQVAMCEFEMIEACQDAAASAEGEARAFLVHRAGMAQVHLFDVDSVLRACGDEPVRYSRCIRHAMLSNGSVESVTTRRARAYDKALARTDLGAELRRLLQLNADEPRTPTLTLSAA